MATIKIMTLIDITNTRVIRLNQGTQLELDQNRNFTTLQQCVEIRSNIAYDNPPSVSTRDIKGLGFGSKLKGQHSVWTFDFTPDREGVYGDDLELLIDDVNGVPIIIKLTETINISKATFDCKDSQYKNTIIQAHLGTDDTDEN